MTPCLPRSLPTRSILGVGAFLSALFVLPGCGGDTYPEDLTYGVRNDALVLEVPTQGEGLPKRFDPPGQLPTLFLQLAENGGKVLDPQVRVQQDVIKRNQEKLHKADSNADKETLQKQIDSAQKEINNRDKAWPEFRAKLDKQLLDLFGTPAHPKVGGLDDAVRGALQLDDATLAKGSKLYRRHCLHCHGVNGDGQGPTAAWVNPHPRDYRLGRFKYTSTTGGNARKPRHEDLIHTLKNGVENTSMPTFGLLQDDELQALVSYVIHLSLRGQVEYGIVKQALQSIFPDGTAGELDTPDELASNLKDLLDGAVRQWQKANNEAIPVNPYKAPTNDDERKASIARGHKIFVDIGCLGCHFDYGRRDNFFFDEWGTIVRPRDLTTTFAYRGGRRPIDLYWRIHGGINGANMPAAIDPNNPKPIDLWDLVNFVEALPYKAMLPDEVREKVFGRDAAAAPKEGGAH